LRPLPDHRWLPWQWAALVVLVPLIGLPVVMPLVELIQRPGAWNIWAEWDRLRELAIHTLTVSLASGMLALALGAPCAVLLARTKLRYRTSWTILLSLSLFIPLPMLLSGWYLVLQTLGAPLAALWTVEARWTGTVLMHALLSLPWVIIILSVGLLWVEPSLEEEMQLYAPPWRVFKVVVLPHCRPYVGMAFLIACWPTWHEISVTDYFKIQTLAEEVYLQLTAGSREDASRALAAMLPWCVLMIAVTLLMMRHWQKALPPRWPSLTRQQRLLLGNWQWAGQLWMLLVIVLLLGIPLFGLMERVGMVYSDTPYWSLVAGWNRVWGVLTRQASFLTHGLVVALGSGLLTTLLTIVLLWISASSRSWQNGMQWWMAILWTIPGPLLGLGLLSLIDLLITMPGGWLSPLLYSDPSPVPNIWVCSLRFLPLAWFALWPVIAQLPEHLEESAWLEGASPWQRFCLHYWSRLWQPGLGVALGVGLLALGEISASKLVTTPGYLPLSHHVFQQLHAGADTEVAALSLVLLIPGLAVMTAVAIWWMVTRRSRC
jgi:ABC-type Fe3+ transport system permease subunit